MEPDTMLAPLLHPFAPGFTAALSSGSSSSSTRRRFLSTTRIRLRTSLGLHEAYVEGYLQAMLDTLYRQPYVTVKIANDTVVLKNLPPNTSLTNEMVTCVTDFLVTEGLLEPERGGSRDGRRGGGGEGWMGMTAGGPAAAAGRIGGSAGGAVEVSAFRSLRRIHGEQMGPHNVRPSLPSAPPLFPPPPLSSLRPPSLPSAPPLFPPPPLSSLRPPSLPSAPPLFPPPPLSSLRPPSLPSAPPLFPPPPLSSLRPPSLPSFPSLLICLRVPTTYGWQCGSS
ncbi:unnamed protein product [Closterium sp. Yama58-4]|nr:unnamed protein product [Closterium sp. Yama58-4]